MTQTKNKFNLRNPKKDLQIVEDNFFRWSNNHHYRTSSNDAASHGNVSFWFDRRYLMVRLLQRSKHVLYRALSSAKIMQFQGIKASSPGLRTAPSSVSVTLRPLARP